ncbi:MAG TPA: DNA-directed RNA polymerase subunit omega [Candidatus Hydrogenedentes bacterium]|nr:DNA-directed RNA polymerase subunit omega [Candidatus Hydrogenedentota bacterium]
MKRISIEQFDDRVDSLYRLVIIAAQRARQVNKPETRPLVPTRSQKPTMIALDEILEGKVTYRTGESDEEDFFD